MPVKVPTRAGYSIPAFPPVTIHGPIRLVKESPVTDTAGNVCRSLSTLEGYSDEAGGHLFDEGGCGHGELEEEERFGTRVELDGEGDVATAVAKECSGDFAADWRFD